MNTAEKMEQSGSNPSKFDFQFILDRAKGMIVNPQGTYDSIKSENMAVPDIYSKYLLIVGAVAPLLNWVKLSILGTGYGNVTYRAPFFSSLVYFIFQYAISLGCIYILALVMEKLAPKFESTANVNNTFRLVAFGLTAGMLSSLFLIIPAIGWLVVLAGGIYSLVTIYKGLPKFVDIAETKRGGFFAASIIIAGLINIVLFAILGAILPVGSGGTLNVGGENIDLNQLENNIKQWEKLIPKP